MRTCKHFTSMVLVTLLTCSTGWASVWTETSCQIYHYGTLECQDSDFDWGLYSASCSSYCHCNCPSQVAWNASAGYDSSGVSGFHWVAWGYEFAAPCDEVHSSVNAGEVLMAGDPPMYVFGPGTEVEASLNLNQTELVIPAYCDYGSTLLWFDLGVDQALVAEGYAYLTSDGVLEADGTYDPSDFDVFFDAGDECWHATYVGAGTLSVTLPVDTWFQLTAENSIGVDLYGQGSADGTVQDLSLVLPEGYEFAPRCPGDLEPDGHVGLSDLAQLLAHYGTTTGASYEDGDLDGDGDVDLADLAELLANYGTVC